MAKIHGATLNGLVNPNGSDASVKFVYGTHPLLLEADSLEVNLSDAISAGRDAVPVSAQITDLEPETKYYFKISATNDFRTSEGNIFDFTTLTDKAATDRPKVKILKATKRLKVEVPKAPEAEPLEVTDRQEIEPLEVEGRPEFETPEVIDRPEVEPLEVEPLEAKDLQEAETFEDTDYQEVETIKATERPKVETLAATDIV